MSNKKEKKIDLKRMVLYVMIIVGIAGIGYSGYQILGIQSEYDKADQVYDQLRKEMQVKPGASDAEALTTVDRFSMLDLLLPSASAESRQAAGEQADESEYSPFDEQGIYLGNDGEAPPEVEKPRTEQKQSVMDFDKLKELNADTVAWITFNDEVIDYPVVQGDDNKFYLTHLFNREWGKAGTIFIDVTNAPDFSDQNTLVFGHHMNNGSMFANIEKYQKQAYYEQYPTMALYTPQGDSTVEWFAGYAISPYRIPTTFETGEEFIAHVEHAKSKSHFQADVEVGPEDRIITLVTCTYGWEDARYILVGVIRDGI